MMDPQRTDPREDARAADLARRFTEVYGRAPDGVWRAPGRVNLLGAVSYTHLTLPTILLV